MNAKNLPLKFAVVAVLAAVCLWSLYTKGCQQGIDLRGGYSLIFEIRTAEAEIAQLRARKDELKRELATASPERKTEIQAALARLDEDIDRKIAGRALGNLADRMIRILKERVDPQGLRNLEWRPIGSNRIEVRMPAGSEDTRLRKDAYERTLEALEAGNFDLSKKRRFRQASPAQRQEMLSGFGATQQDRLKKLAAAYEAADAAAKAVDEAKAGTDARKAAEAAYNNARAAVRDAEKGVEDLNIRRSRLEAILANYRTVEEERALQLQERSKLREQLASGLGALRKPQDKVRRAQIDQAAEAYRAWADVRQRLDDPADLQRLIAKAGVLEFRIVTLLTGERGMVITPEQRGHYVNLLKKEGPEEVRRRGGPFAWFPVREEERDSFAGLVVEEYAGKPYVLLCNQAGYVLLRDRREREWSLVEAFRDQDRMGMLAVGFRFDEAGAKRFYNLTSSHKGKYMAILLDDEAISAPRIQEAISERGVITGRFTSDQVDEMIRLLEAGSLPARLNPNPVAVRGFGPSLGQENRKRGVRAAYIGLICVAVFMLVYYLMAGCIADVALLLNIVLVLGAMSVLDAVFTLPGIAGVILTIGIAVDANVLIFERLREEQAKGQSIRMALKNAYERAFSAIFDANLTTMITCLILGWVGTLEVRGFAITLGLGVAFSMFTALVVTRWIFQLLLDTKLLAKPVFMLHIIGTPNVNWMGKRRLFWALSLVLIVLGVASLVWQGSDIWGIEFSSGTQAVVQFRSDAMIPGAAGAAALPNDELVRVRFREKAAELAARDPNYEKLRATARVETVLEPDRVAKFLETYDADENGKITQAEARAAKMSGAFFAALGGGENQPLDRTALAGRLPAASYQISTTESRLERIQDVVREAFGESLARRTRCQYELAAREQVAELGLTTNEQGIARVEVVDGSPYQPLLEEYVDGVAVVVRNVRPPITEPELRQRIHDMRYEGQMRRTAVIGRDPQGEGRFASFAVLVKLDVVPSRWPEAAAEEVGLVRDALGREEMMPTTNFDAAIAGQAAQRAVIAVVLSWVAIVLYLWLRFGSIQWGLAAVICLIHDVIVVVGMVAASGWLYDTVVGRALGMESFKIDLAMVAAVLTVIGYSVNDTIVVFDRIRENRGKLATVSVPVINKSINQTLARTLLTSGTTFIVVFIMYVWGGQGIKAFNYALLMGIIFGTYSSVAVASPLLMGFRQALVAKVAPAVAVE